MQGSTPLQDVTIHDAGSSRPLFLFVMPPFAKPSISALS
jgi:hypothetical protein